MKKKILIAIAACLIIFQAGLQIYLAKTDSATTDEAVHLSAGYTYLTRRDFRFNPEHPSLVKMIAAFPLVFVRPNLPDDNLYWNKSSAFFYDSWHENRDFGEAMLYKVGNNADKILFSGRLPMIFLTLILAISIFLISKKMWGLGGGLISLALFVFDPNFTAHGHLVTTDIAISLGYLLSIFLLWRFLNKPNWTNALFFGLVLGFAELVKFTAIIILPATFLLLIYYFSYNKIKTWPRIKPYFKIFVSIAIMWFLIMAGYMFKMTPSPKTNSIISSIESTNYTGLTSEEQLRISKLQPNSIDKIYQTLRPIILPRDYFKGMIMVITHVGAGQSSFLLGQTSKTGWWYYFPVLLFTKTPVYTLVLIFGSLSLFVFRRNRNKQATFFALAAVIFLIFAMTSKADLGLRHIFPIYPLLFIIVGGVYTLKKKLIKPAIAILFAGLIIEFWLSFPNYLSYFNFVSGGTINGYKIAGDSNYNWGQDLKRIKIYMDDHHIQSAWIDYSWDGPSALKYYNINANSETISDANSKGYLIAGAEIFQNGSENKYSLDQIVDRITPGVFLLKLGDK